MHIELLRPDTTPHAQERGLVANTFSDTADAMPTELRRRAGTGAQRLK